MTDSATIFQRTHTGREEIHNKSHGLTQSERLVLIMVDGVSTYQGIRSKLSALTDDRFNRALQKLVANELIVEVFMPLDDQTPDELERTVIDRFLRQDPMDPVTVMLQDPEDELDLLKQARHAIAQWEPSIETVPPKREAMEDFPMLVDTAAPPAPAFRKESALAAEDVQAADDLMEELRAKRAQRPLPPPPQPIVVPPKSQMQEEEPQVSGFGAVHWGYWLIVAGLAFILGFFIARLVP
ncbi:hypothetical protein [Noviherbaspirillum denitrificans]|uniref:Uncharacterized protein n=1 Tax=Noviherbaspirillum denitrificans TaxID=1968433 RepID=A0A254T7Q9_9BURK|nr:hypothetical protein [Noviherbaspirillum denitrificans]OWW18207.1 hypothetical protein AYR66_01490 [Noviherbaspirillum denitrificans]